MKNKNMEKNKTELQKLQNNIMQIGIVLLFGIVGVLIFTLIMIKIDFEYIKGLAINNTNMFMDFIVFTITSIVFMLVIILIGFITVEKLKE